MKKSNSKTSTRIHVYAHAHKRQKKREQSNKAKKGSKSGFRTHAMCTLHMLHNIHATIIHIVFDDCHAKGPSPKKLLRRVRNVNNSQDICTVDHDQALTPSTPLPRSWRKGLACRDCKRQLIVFLSQHTLLLVKPRLQQHQWVVSTGGFDGAFSGRAVAVNPEYETLVAVTNFTSNAEEADSRVWRHALGYEKALVYSPDTDTFHVALPFSLTTTVIVRLDMPGSPDRKYLDLNALQNCIQANSDLQHIPGEARLATLQCLYVATGCDFVSFFHGFGKVSFLKCFFFSMHHSYAQTQNHSLTPATQRGMLASYPSFDL